MSALRSMNPRDRRALVLAAAVLVPSLGYIWGVKPFIAALGQMRDQVAVERETFARERAAVTAARLNPGLQRTADSAMRVMEPRLFKGRDDVMASAELVTHLGEIALANDVWLQDAATRPTVVGDAGVRILRVEIRAESDITGVLQFLQALERGDKLVRVDRIDISRSLAGSDVEGVEPLAIAASIIGYAIPEPTEAADTTAARTASKGAAR